jgi:hypothetical protein
MVPKKIFYFSLLGIGTYSEKSSLSDLDYMIPKGTS